jgi:(p)ppGpp synthase/HD superfamily hydrolase
VPLNLPATLHEGTIPQIGESYICHPVAARWNTSVYGGNSVTIAAIFSTTLWKIQILLEEIEQRFGAKCDSWLKVSPSFLSLIFSSKTERAFAENFRRMFLAMAKDIPSVIVVKLADGCNNMRIL